MASDHPDVTAPIPPDSEGTSSSPAVEARPAAAAAPEARSSARRALWAAGVSAAALGLVFVAMARQPGRTLAPPSTVAPAKAAPAKTAPAAGVVVRPAAVRPANAAAGEDREALAESVVQSQEKRIMGRKRSLPDIARIVEQISPLVARALEQPSIQPELRRLAAQEGMSLAEYKRYFQRIQEADLLLESGGDPNARSPSDAIGVAQFLAGTARASGNLRVNVAEGRRLTGRIARMQWEIASLERLPEDWTKPIPGSRPARTLIASAAAGGQAKASGKASGSRASLSSRGAEADREAITKTAAASTPEPPKPAPEAPAAEPAAGTGPSATVTPAATGEANVPAPATGEATVEPAAAPVSEAPEKTEPPAEAPKPKVTAPGVITRDELIRKRVRELRQLEAKRRAADERYDPAKAIAAQTRYLVRLARRYGSLDWAFQAYHGGEGGVRNTVSYYLGSRWQQFASTEGAIRGVLASRGGSEIRVRAPLSFEELYFKTTPVTHPKAFSYLYGRSDNHRYYWWKVLAAERAIAIYREDPAEFRRQWRTLRPGQRKEVYWYPDSKALNFRDVADLKRGYASGELVRWPAAARNRGLVLGKIAPLDPANAYHYKGLRPEALGALYRIAGVYLANGGSKQPLRVLSLVQTEAYRAKLNAVRPPYWMRYRTEPDEIPIDLEPTGLCVDLERPAADWNRKVLEYALGYLADRDQITWIEEREQGPRRYHVCPSPKFRGELARDVRPAGGGKKKA